MKLNNKIKTIFSTIGILSVFALLQAQTPDIERHRGLDQDKQICINDGGVEKCITLDGPTGNLGIGTASPTTLGHLYTNDGSTNTILSLTSATGRYSSIYLGDTADEDVGGIEYENSSDTMVFRAGATNTMYVKGGNVGIGTAGPTNLGTGSGPVLDVEGTIQVKDPDNSTGRGMNMQVLHTETLSSATATSSFSPPKVTGNALGIIFFALGGGNNGMIFIVQADDDGTFSLNTILGQSGSTVASATLVKVSTDNWQIQGMVSNSEIVTISWLGINI